MGTFVFVFYICAFGFYLWIRIAKTLDLGQYLPYGIFVLFVECMGATTVVLYGTNLLWNPVNEIVLQESEDGIGPGKLKVSQARGKEGVPMQLKQYMLHLYLLQVHRCVQVPWLLLRSAHASATLLSVHQTSHIL